MNRREIKKVAQKYIDKGYSIIPVSASKTPLVPWTEFQTRRATIDEVLAWYAKFPDMQLGIVTGRISGIAVIDVEAGGDHSQFPPTVTAKTGGGGYHLYYKYVDGMGGNRTRITELVDIRSDGGYVVAPPSISSKGGYTWLSDPQTDEIQLFPVDIISTLDQSSTENLVETGERNIRATQKAGEILARLPDPEQRNEAYEHLRQWNLSEIAEPLSDSELGKVFASVAKREDNKRSEDDLVLKPYTLNDLYAEEFPPIEWVAEDLLPIGMVAAITGESNSYKSFLTLALAQAIATGEPFLGNFPVKQGKVLVIDEENNRRIIEKRFRDMGVAGHDNILFLSQKGIQLDNATHVKKLKQAIDQIDPVLVVLDSLVRFHGKDENSASEMRQVMKSIGTLVNERRSVIFIHHHKKEQFGTSSSGSNSVRGSTDIFNALDCHIGIKKKSETIVISQNKLRIQKECPAFNVIVDDFTGKHLKFVYNGQDNSRQELLEKVKSCIASKLYEAAGEELPRKELITVAGASNKIGTEALKQLREEEVITCRASDHGRHMYSINEQSEHSDQEDGLELENTEGQEIEVDAEDSIPY